MNNMSQKQLPEYDLNKLKFFLSQFEELNKDIELLKKQRAILELPLDLSINLAPVDKNDEDSYLQALQDYEKPLQQGVKDPLIFDLKKIFEQNYREFKDFMMKSSFSHSNLTEEVNKEDKLDDALTKLVDEIKEFCSNI